MDTHPINQGLLPKGAQTQNTSCTKVITGKSFSLAEKLSLFDSTLPRESAKTIPPLWYLDPEIYEAERSTVFGKNWLAVGRVGEVSSPRSYFQLQVAEEPVIVIRGEDGVLRALSNVCRHRATELLTDAKGILSVNEMKCQYHGWCYDLTGRLCSAPEMGKVTGFSREGYSLVPFEVDMWDPLVFLRMQGGTDPLLTTIEPLIQRTAGRNLSSFKWAARKEYEIACNWKVFVDNFLDGGYHIKTAHPGLVGTLDNSKYRTEIFERSSLQQCPTKAGGDAASAVRQGSDAMYWWIYPNVMINIYKDAMDTNIVLPLGPDRCKVIFDFYFASNWDQSSIDEYIKSSHQVQLEDIELSKRVQRGLNSRFYTPGPYGKREGGQYHFHKLLTQDLQKVFV